MLGDRAVLRKYRGVAITNLADKSDEGKVSVHIEAISESGLDRSWLRNTVEEPLDELNVEVE